jgi:uncharacterized protein (TIGR02391 family)
VAWSPAPGLGEVSRLAPVLPTKAAVSQRAAATLRRPQFLIGRYELAVFAPMKAVKVRVRQLAGLGNDAYGVDLMKKAFGTTGPLTDLSANRGEQEGTRELFAGTYAVLRNPAGHREIDYETCLRLRRLC